METNKNQTGKSIHGGGSVLSFPKEPDCVITLTRLDDDSMQLSVDGFDMKEEAPSTMQAIAILGTEHMIELSERYQGLSDGS